MHEHPNDFSRHFDDKKRGYPTTVGALARIINRTKTQRFLLLTPDEREVEIDAALKSTARTYDDGVGEQVDVLRALGDLTPGQLTLLRAKVRR